MQDLFFRNNETTTISRTSELFLPKNVCNVNNNKNNYEPEMNIVISIDDID